MGKLRALDPQAAFNAIDFLEEHGESVTPPWLEADGGAGV